MVILRDGRHLVGTLSSYDQYSNIMLEGAMDRHFAPSVEEEGKGKYTDIPFGTFVVRGDNIVLIAELDEDKEREHPAMDRTDDLDAVLKLEREAEEALRARSLPSLRRIWHMAIDE